MLPVNPAKEIALEAIYKIDVIGGIILLKNIQVIVCGNLKFLYLSQGITWETKLKIATNNESFIFTGIILAMTAFFYI